MQGNRHAVRVCVHDERGLAQFFGRSRSKAGKEVDAENLCLTPSNCERPSKSVNGYESGYRQARHGWPNAEPLSEKSQAGISGLLVAGSNCGGWISRHLREAFFFVILRASVGSP